MTDQRERTHFFGDGCATHGQPEQVPLEARQGLAGLASLLEVSVKTINRWAERSRQTGFPPPIEKDHYRRTWDAREVEAWHGYWKLTRRG